ncbi:hypothetical protein [Chelativorans sp. Marseille-P2723]|uniref:hypothetical protein n=1 Tax=Chelativorans sp. Marseille-P2723 TaxID=2709133 RepID=UPI00156EC88E|nr:hypothetical protein [Chelativorans sp. Marseille-P2723]
MRRQLDADLEGFDTFWKLWRGHCRKTDGRGKARPAYQQMLQLGADPQDIIDGARWYLRNMSDRDAPYIPLASTWLRSERWADDCELERAYQARLQERQSQSNVVSMSASRPTKKTRFLEYWERMKAENA